MSKSKKGTSEFDGEQLIELFQDKLIGLKTKTVHEFDHAFFDEFRRES
jgi:restriction system protein